MIDPEKETLLGGPPLIGGTYPATASAYLRVCAGGSDFSILAPVLTEALKRAGLSVTVSSESLGIAGIYEAPIPEYRMDETIWRELVRLGYKQRDVTPIAVRNIFSGGQHGGGKARMYIYEVSPGIDQISIPVFVAKGEGSDALMDTVRDIAREHPYNLPDFDQIVQHLIKPAYESQRWAPLMSDTRDLVGRALFTGHGVPDITYLADSMIAMMAGDEGLEYLPIPNADKKPRFVATWTELIRS